MASKYKENKIPLVIIAGKEYGSGSSRDWAAKGTLLLGVLRAHYPLPWSAFSGFVVV